MTEYNGLEGVHRIMNNLDPTSTEYSEALQVLADPLSNLAKQFCKKHRLPPITSKPDPEDLLSF